MRLFVDAAGEGHAVLVEIDIERNAVRPNEALGVFVDHAGFRARAALHGKGAGAGAATQKLGLFPAKRDGLVGVDRR